MYARPTETTNVVQGVVQRRVSARVHEGGAGSLIRGVAVVPGPGRLKKENKYTQNCNNTNTRARVEKPSQ